MKELKAREYKRFEDVKQIRADGTKFWCCFLGGNIDKKNDNDTIK